MNHLQPILYGRMQRKWRRPISAGYGERKRQREVAKVPLLAELPGMVESAEVYQQNFEHTYQSGQQRYRQELAERWREVRRWLRQADSVDRMLFWHNWRYLPHDPWYALDLILDIERCWGGGDGREPGLRFGAPHPLRWTPKRQPQQRTNCAWRRSRVANVMLHCAEGARLWQELRAAWEKWHLSHNRDDFREYGNALARYDLHECGEKREFAD